MTVRYEDWGQVPWFMASRTQLLTADLPREPVGRAGGQVRTYHRGRRQVVGLYRVESSRPTAASARQLEAAAGRRTQETHVCGECGACCDRPLVVRDGHGLCPMCRRMREVAAFQASLGERRRQLAQWAQGLLGDARLAVVWVETVQGGHTPSGRARPLAAARVTAVDGEGNGLADLVVRFAGARGCGVPQGACAPPEGAAVLERALDGRRVLAWTEAQVSALTSRLEALGCPLRLSVVSSRPEADWDGWQTSVRDRVAQWRGQLDPASGMLLPAWEPGRADRLRLLLTRMAQGACLDR
ncbi:hypothetical protein ABZX85_44245 [Streptomyces sp. NPDC004539]|uniref:hypothetical protein n=1 Tax=Streptomyces sp. NPDC004539 TaxID=3154280 RepID=UPI0033A9B2C9